MATVRVPVIAVVAVVCLLAGMLVSNNLPRAISQEQPQVKPCDVAVLDTSRVFDKFEGFQAQMASLKKEVDAFELSTQQTQKELQDLKQLHDAAEKGSEAALRLQAEMEIKTTNLKIERNQKGVKFLEKEAGIYFQRYKQMLGVVEDITHRKQIRIVLRYNSTKIDGGKRESVLEGVNRGVIYQDQIDITDEVIKAVNAG